MQINRINNTFTAVNFKGLDNKRNKNNSKNNLPSEQTPTIVHIPANKLNNALKAAIIIPVVSLPLVMGSCSKDEQESDYWAQGYPGTSIKYPAKHIMPEFKVDSITFANDTVIVPKELSEKSRINRNINNLLDKINIPRYTEGTLPAAFTFKTDKYIQYMILDGVASAESDNKTLFYDVQRYKNNGEFKMFRLEFSADDDDVVMKTSGLGNNSSEYVFKAQEDGVQSYQNIDGRLVPIAKYEQGDTRDYTIQQTRESGDTVKFDNINAIFIKNDYEK